MIARSSYCSKMPSLLLSVSNKHLQRRFAVIAMAAMVAILSAATLINNSKLYSATSPEMDPSALFEGDLVQSQGAPVKTAPPAKPIDKQVDADANSTAVVVAHEDADILQKFKQKNEQIRSQFLDNLPPCAAQGPAKTFFLVFMGHSGSTAIMTSLKQHSQTHIDGFEPVDHGIYVGEPKKETSLRALNYSFQFFRKSVALKKTGGFKIRPRNLQIRPNGFTKLVEMFDTRLVWSYRTNVMKQAVGTYTTAYLNDTSAYEGLKIDDDGNVKETNRSTRFKIHDMGILHKILKDRIRGDLEVAAALQKISPDNCVLPVSYESFLRQPKITMQRVQHFLGLNLDESHPPLRAKATQDSLCDVVENWKQLCEAFFGCFQWRWMLDDYENGCTCSEITPSTFNLTRKYCAMS